MKLGITLLALAAAANTVAGQTNFGAGSQAAAWLKLPNSARTAAMGEAGVAVADDVNALTENPAGLAGLQGHEASLLHHAYVQDSAMEHAALGMKLGEHGGTAVGVDYLNFGTVETFNVVGSSLVPTGSINPSGLALNLGYGQALGPISAGVTAKYISQNLAGSASTAYAADLGLLWRKDEKNGLSLGAALQNLGSTLDGANLPLNIKAGAAYQLPAGGENNLVLLALDANVPSADAGAYTGNFGLQYSVGGLYALRGGYKLAGNGGAGGFSAGAGLNYSIVGVDYAFVDQGALGNSNQVSLNLKF